MVLNLIQKLNERIRNIVGIVLHMLILILIGSLVMCFAFGAIGKIAKLSYMTTLAGFCILIFLIVAVVLITIGVILLICFIIDAIKRDGLKKLLKTHIKTFTVLFIILLVIHFIKFRNLNWIGSFLSSLTITLSLFFKTQINMVGKEIEQ